MTKYCARHIWAEAENQVTLLEWGWGERGKAEDGLEGLAKESEKGISVT